MPTKDDPRITVRLPRSEREKLAYTAKQLGISEGEVVRRGLKMLMTPEETRAIEKLADEIRAEGTSTAAAYACPRGCNDSAQIERRCRFCRTTFVAQ